ncbi:MAG: EAL domain-containing protein, partial [Rhodocyclaceae bacterium]|nr:EAL domain-containing protein [Rhodocyclaceae bacterium]
MATEEIFIGRQPILDRSQQLFAYELLFRSGSKDNFANIHDNLSATASVIHHAFAELGIEQALGPNKGFINCDASLLQSDMLEILPTDKIVLEILETVEITPQIVERCTDLKARGFALAVDDFVADESKWQPILGLIDIVKVDLIALSQERLCTVTRSLQRQPLTLLAEKVETREQADHCHQLGYHFFQGYFFARPAIIAGHKLGHSQLTLIRLLGLVLEEADTATLEGIFKQEPGLAVNLLRLTNSVATGVRGRVTSLRHAITVLGRRQLQRWLQLLLFTNPAGDSQVANPLLQLAATRGRFLELLAGKLEPGTGELEDRAFMTGIMSLIPVLMGVPLEEILKGIQL